MLPHTQRGPAMLTLMCPISPALWWWPRIRRPSRIRPPPMPVPMARVTNDAAPRPSPNIHSPSVSAFTSLSTKTAWPLRSWMRAASGTSPSSVSHPNGIERMKPLSTSTRPGRPTPIPETERPRSAAAASARSISAKMLSAIEPSPLVGAWAVASTVPSAATSPAEIVDAPTSTPTIGSDGIFMRPRVGKPCARAETRSASARAGREVQARLAGRGGLRGKRASGLAPRAQDDVAGPTVERARSRCPAPARRPCPDPSCRLLLRVHGLVAPRQLASPTWRNQGRPDRGAPADRHATLPPRFRSPGIPRVSAGHAACSPTARRRLGPSSHRPISRTGGSIMRRIVPVVLMLTALVALPVRADEHAHTVALPDALRWAEPAPLPGALLAVVQGDPSKEGLFVYRLKMPAGYRIPAHLH